MQMRLPLPESSWDFPVLFPVVEARALRDGWAKDYELPASPGGRRWKVSVRTKKIRNSDGDIRFVCEAAAQGFRFEVTADSKGIVERMEMPGGFSVRREPSGAILAMLRRQGREGAVSPQIQAWTEQGEKWMNLLWEGFR